MKNIFAKFQNYVKKPNRNVFDLTFRNNLTLKFGELTPVFCKEVVPGDSFKIDTQFGLMLMPMKFPVQTPMKAYVHYFYVRNRTLWKDWMDFIGGTKENLVLPYVQPLDKKKFYRVGGLADYLGVPNTLYSSELPNTGYFNSVFMLGQPNVLNSSSYIASYQTGTSTLRNLYVNQGEFFDSSVISFTGMSANDSSITDVTIAGEVVGKDVANSVVTIDRYVYASLYEQQLEYSGAINQQSNNTAFRPMQYLGDYPVLEQNLLVKLTPSYYWEHPFRASYGSATIESARNFYLIAYDSSNKYVSVAYVPNVSNTIDSQNRRVFEVNVDSTIIDKFNMAGAVRFKLGLIAPYYSQTAQDANGYGYATSGTNFIPVFGDSAVDSDVVIETSGSVSISDLESTPYDSSIHLNALPFRAYEAIYNAYYRNAQNNPFILNGVPEYNKYITNNEGGADNTQYDLYFRNWEYDFLTSAVQSPQQGVAPLVGMSVTGEASFVDENGNTYYAQAILDDDGNITGWQSHSSDMPVGSLRMLMNMAGTGISINDLRNVNAFQRFLENNIRHGLKYRDQIMSHFGVKVRFDELDMPEFIGGVSGEMEVYKVTQTSNSGETPLGSFVGQAQIKKYSNHSVTHYCDEHGFIIGIMSVVPVPVYSQLLPKVFTKSSQLDYFFPEFGHIGYQPILQKEVSPLQTFYSGSDLNKVFGYQRAWYDYLASTDEVHSQFRTTMRDFIMNRTFEDEPELGEEFLLVDPNQLNDVFLAGTDDNNLYAPEADKIIGSLLFNVSAKRPIPMFGIPKLEA